MTDRSEPAPADTEATDAAVADAAATDAAVTDAAVTDGVPSDTEASAAAASPEAALEPIPAVKPTKAEKLEAKAARLRAAEERRAEAAAQGAPGHSGARPTGLIVAVSVLAVVTVALAVVLVMGYVSWQHQRDINSARAQASKAATSFAVDFGTYDYQHLDTEFSAVAARMTSDFAKSYTATSTQLKPTLLQYKTKVTAAVRGSGVTSVSTGKATVVVFLDQTVITSQSSTPRIDRNRLQIQLVHSNGKWLVAKLLAK